MPRSYKVFLHNTVIELTFRAEEGLPFVCKPYIQAIVNSVLARALCLYDFTLCHFVLMGNHVHMLGVVNDPEGVDSFVEYFKRETASAINRLLGRKKHTVWCEGYDSPVVLDEDKVKERIHYLYCNPARANLVNSIDEYPGLSSWKAFQTGDGKISAKRITRDAIPRLPKRTLSTKEEQFFTDTLLEEAVGSPYEAEIQPNAWMRCFNIEPERQSRINESIFKRIEEQEERFESERTKPVMGAAALKLERIRMDFLPKKFGKRMKCLSSLTHLRKQYLDWYSRHFGKTKINAQTGKRLPPPGAFLPGGVMLANVNMTLMRTAIF